MLKQAFEARLTMLAVPIESALNQAMADLYPITVEYLRPRSFCKAMKLTTTSAGQESGSCPAPVQYSANFLKRKW